MSNDDYEDLDVRDERIDELRKQQALRRETRYMLEKQIEEMEPFFEVIDYEMKKAIDLRYVKVKD